MPKIIKITFVDKVLFKLLSGYSVYADVGASYKVVLSAQIHNRSSEFFK